MTEHIAPIWNFLLQTAPSLIEEGLLLWLFRFSAITLLSLVLFLLFPSLRRILLLGTSLAYGIWLLGIFVLFAMMAFCLIWFSLLKFSDRFSEEKSKKALQWLILLLTSAIYFGLMNAYRWGFELPKPSVQELGISYLYLRVIHVTVDWIRGKMGSPSPLLFFLYTFYFPTMMYGPLERYQTFIQRPFFTSNGFWRPDLDPSLVLRILGGLSKILLCATFLDLPYKELWNQTTTLPYSELIKIYYLRAISFYLFVSGCNDIGIMFSKFLRIPISENYNYPYFRKNLAHFWRNWHMTLSTILRDYVYEPLGGRRKHQRLNYIFTFFFCAMWHVTSPAFVIWGLMHGLGLVGLRIWQDIWADSAERVPGFGKGLVRIRDGMRALPRLGMVLGALVTFHFVALTWLPFWGGHPQGTIALLRILGLDFLMGPILH